MAASRSPQEVCYDDPKLVLITEDDYFDALCAAQNNATANFGSENPSYSVTDWIISIHCAICNASEKGGAFLCNPQARLRWGDQSRVTDFGAILLHDRPSATDGQPSRPSRLVYIAEIKHKDNMDDWRAPIHGTNQCQAFESHIEQVSEQAYFAFRHYGMKVLYAFLIIGNDFVFFKYDMPKDIAAYAPCRKVDPSEELGKLLSDPNPRKRRRVASSTGPYCMLEPDVIYAYEKIISATGRSFSPPFRKALDMAVAPHVKSRQPSWFQAPPGDYVSPESSLELAYGQITRAANKVSGKDMQDDIALAVMAHPLPKTTDDQDPPKPTTNQNSDFKASGWLKKSAAALPPRKNKGRSSRANSVSSYKENSDEETPDSEPRPSSSRSSLVDALGNLRTDDGALPLPASSRPSSPIKRSAHYRDTNADPSSSAPAAAEVLVPKRKTRSAKKSDHMLSMLTRHAQTEEQDNAVKGKDTKGKGRAA